MPIVHNNQVSIKNEEIKNENIKEENKENNISDKEKNENEKNEIINKEEKKIEYDIYLNTSEIFTILPLIGCRIMNLLEEENIYKDLKDKLIRDQYLSKKDFMEYHFWFEQELEYQNEDMIFQQMLEENSNNNINFNIGISYHKNNIILDSENKNKKINIKEFLFNIWKDEKGERIDFEKFISVLKINKYITDLNGLNEENYYNIIFQNES